MNDAQLLKKPISPNLDQILGKQIKVLDDGFIRLVDYMGNEASIVQAARVSYGEGTKKINEDKGLIRYLMRHWHTTPFEMAELKLHVRVPMDTWRQWIRHRTANVNEYSTRYSIAIDSAQTTQPTEWRNQAINNKQGSDGFLPEDQGGVLSVQEAKLQGMARRVYQERIEAGVAREQARKDLPLSTYTEAYWKIDLHNLLHFLWLRMDSHAQKEIREYATTIGQQIVAPWMPNVWQAFQDYRQNAITFTGPETIILGQMLQNPDNTLETYLIGKQWTTQNGKLNREAQEFRTKYELLQQRGNQQNDYNP